MTAKLCCFRPDPRPDPPSVGPCRYSSRDLICTEKNHGPPLPVLFLPSLELSHPMHAAFKHDTETAGCMSLRAACLISPVASTGSGWTAEYGSRSLSSWERAPGPATDCSASDALGRGADAIYRLNVDLHTHVHTLIVPSPPHLHLVPLSFSG